SRRRHTRSKRDWSSTCALPILGYSTARWDGDTLVVETSGFNDKTWLDTQQGHPASDALQVTERFRRPDFGHLEMQATIDDPKARSEERRVGKECRSRWA